MVMAALGKLCDDGLGLTLLEFIVN